MWKQIKCRDLGVVDCEFVAQGETQRDVAQQIVKHLRSEHHLNIPAADVILSKDELMLINLRDGMDDVNEGERLVIGRLSEALEIVLELETGDGHSKRGGDYLAAL